MLNPALCDVMNKYSIIPYVTISCSLAIFIKAYKQRHKRGAYSSMIGLRNPYN